MPNLLSILASPRGEYSVSRALTATFVEEWKKNHTGGSVVTRDLHKTELPFVDLPWILGAYTPAELHSPETKKALIISDELIAELQATDHIVIGTPMYNFSTPAILKAYIDHIVRIGTTVTSSYEGLLKNKKATIIISSGGEYAPGSQIEGYNAESGYLKQILSFIGITDVHIVLAGGSSAVDLGKVSRVEHLAQYADKISAAAK